jgi:hypothetical protein
MEHKDRVMDVFDDIGINDNVNLVLHSLKLPMFVTRLFGTLFIDRGPALADSSWSVLSVILLLNPAVHGNHFLPQFFGTFGFVTSSSTLEHNH